MKSSRFQIGDRVHRKHLPSSFFGTVTLIIGTGLRVRWDDESVSNWYLRDYLKLVEDGLDKLDEIL